MELKISTKYFWLGVLTMALGVFVLLNAVLASAAIVTVTGIFLLIGGTLQIALGLWSEGLGNRILTWCLGALTAFLGWSFMANPLALFIVPVKIIGNDRDQCTENEFKHCLLLSRRLLQLQAQLSRFRQLSQIPVSPVPYFEC